MAQELASCKRADGSLRSHWLNYLHGGNVSNVRVNFIEVDAFVRVADTFRIYRSEMTVNI